MLYYLVTERKVPEHTEKFPTYTGKLILGRSQDYNELTKSRDRLRKDKITSYIIVEDEEANND